MSDAAIQEKIRAALELHRAGNFQEAEKVYRQVLAQRPNDARALQYLGILAYQFGKPQIAVDLIQRSISIDPNAPDSYYNLGNALLSLGNAQRAAEAYTKAIEIKPNFPEALSNFGSALVEQDKPNEAIAVCNRALAIDSGLANPHIVLGNAYVKMRRFDEAAASFANAIRLKPDWPDGYVNLGHVLGRTGRDEEAIAACSKAIALRPDSADAFVTLGIALMNQRRFVEAETAIKRACALQPSSASAHMNLAFLLLLQGRFPEGWLEYEWRWQWKEFRSSVRNFSQPPWKGEDIRGRTILVHTEGGFGDAIQFVRYLPDLAEKGANVILECPRELLELFAGIPGIQRVVVRGEVPREVDIQCPLLSLPGIFKTRLETIPANIPYLNPNPRRIETWRRRLEAPQGNLRIGLAWAGNPVLHNDHRRSTELAKFSPLGSIPGVTFFSLQKGVAGDQVKNPPTGMRLVDLGPQLADFADTAAVISLLDLVITIDSSMAHLAGAMAHPVWTILGFPSEWRWLVDREDSPWYPTMRLFRLRALGDWESAIDSVMVALRERMKLTP
jgi:Flp pilus assembly protein TadD